MDDDDFEDERERDRRRARETAQRWLDDEVETYGAPYPLWKRIRIGIIVGTIFGPIVNFQEIKSGVMPPLDAIGSGLLGGVLVAIIWHAMRRAW